MSVQTENREWQEVRKGSMNRLFDTEAQHRPDMAPVVSAEGREGELIGSREGKVKGEKIRGTIWVTFYSAECVFPQGPWTGGGRLLSLEQATALGISAFGDLLSPISARSSE